MIYKFDDRYGLKIRTHFLTSIPVILQIGDQNLGYKYRIFIPYDETNRFYKF